MFASPRLTKARCNSHSADFNSKCMTYSHGQTCWGVLSKLHTKLQTSLNLFTEWCVLTTSATHNCGRWMMHFVHKKMCFDIKDQGEEESVWRKSRRDGIQRFGKLKMWMLLEKYRVVGKCSIKDAYLGCTFVIWQEYLGCYGQFKIASGFVGLQDVVHQCQK